MGDANQLFYFKAQPEKRYGRVLEIGSKDYGATGVPWKSFVEHDEYIGLDLEEGPGVDVVHNLEHGLGPIAEGSIDLVICCSVLEHTPTPWKLAAAIEDALKPSGEAYIAVPWVHRYHAYPDDYYRFSFSAIGALFPRLKFDCMHYSTLKTGEFHLAENRADSVLALKIDGRKYLPYLQLHAWGRRV